MMLQQNLQQLLSLNEFSNKVIIGKWINNDGNIQKGAIFIENGKYTYLGIADYSIQNLKGFALFDASDYLMIPGFIDCHVHFREPGEAYKEGILNGSRAALKGGVTTILDMPNNIPPITSLYHLKNKQKRFEKKCLVNYGFHLLALSNQKLINSNNKEKNSYVSAKIYMAKSSLKNAITKVEELKQIFTAYNCITIHAEDETQFVQNEKEHHLRRPRSAIISALNKIESAYLSIPKKERPRIIIAHVSTKEEIQWLSKMKHDFNADIFGETCLHYLFLTQEDHIKQQTDILSNFELQVNPPLRTQEDQNAILEALKNGTIDFISSDHAPHSVAEKFFKKDHSFSGIPSIEWMMPLCISLVDKKIISWSQLLKLTCINPSLCFGIKNRDGIKKGNFADLVFLEMHEPKLINDPIIITKAQYNPYKLKFESTATVKMAIISQRGFV